MEEKRPVGRPRKEDTIQNNGGEYVVVEFNGIGTWILDYKGRGTKLLTKGDREKFNIHDKAELRVLLQVLKQVNRPRINRIEYVDKNDPTHRVKYIERFVIVEGLENLPKCLREIQYSPTNTYSDEEKEAILSLCPDFFE